MIQTTKKMIFSADIQYHISAGCLCLIVLRIAFYTVIISVRITPVCLLKKSKINQDIFTMEGFGRTSKTIKETLQFEKNRCKAKHSIAVKSDMIHWHAE